MLQSLKAAGTIAPQLGVLPFPDGVFPALNPLLPLYTWKQLLCKLRCTNQSIFKTPCVTKDYTTLTGQLVPTEEFFSAGNAPCMSHYKKRHNSKNINLYIYFAQTIILSTPLPISQVHRTPGEYCCRPRKGNLLFINGKNSNQLQSSNQSSCRSVSLCMSLGW